MTLELHLAGTWPVLAPALGALLVLLLDVVRPATRRSHLVLAAAALLGGAAAAASGTTQSAGDARGAFCLPDGACLYAAGSLASGLQLLGLGAAAVVLVLAWADWAEAPAAPAGRGDPAVSAALFLAATAGVAAVPAARDLGSLLVALELATLPVVALIALDRRASRVATATDGAVALLTTSLVSFALLALGAALWVAATGTGLLSPVAAAGALDAPAGRALLTLAAVLVVAGIGYKISAVPFHAWTPVAYTRAPLPVTVYLAGVSKIAALGGLIALVRGLGDATGGTLLVTGVLAALSMTVGNVLALRQRDAVRLLAWSAVAQAGWVLLPLAVVSARATHAAAGYLAVYVVATLLAFAVVMALAETSGGDTALHSHRSLLRTRPLPAAALILSLLTLAGLPPAVVGLVAKVVALRPVAGEGIWWLAVVAALNVALGVAVYLRWVATVVARPAPARGAPADALQTPGSAGAPDTDPPSWRWPHRVVVTLLAGLLVAGSIAPVGIW